MNRIGYAFGFTLGLLWIAIRHGGAVLLMAALCYMLGYRHGYGDGHDEIIEAIELATQPAETVR